MHVLLMYSTHEPSPEHVARLEGLGDAIRVTVAESEETARAAARDAEVIFGHRYLRQSLPQARRLRWVQSTAGGTDRLPRRELARKQVVLTRMTATAPTVARHAVTLAWAIARRLPNAMDRQTDGRWEDGFDWPPRPEEALVLGTGHVGGAIAERLCADQIRCYGARRTPSSGSTDPFDRIYDRASWPEVLPRIDWLFLALPHTPETRNLVGEEVLRALPARAIVVNVGRGETLVTEDLCGALASGHLSGAALDVVHPRPTGPEDPIWETPRLLITPHVGAHSRERSRTMERFCEEQLARYLAGEPLENRVASERGSRAAEPS